MRVQYFPQELHYGIEVVSAGIKAYLRVQRFMLKKMCDLDRLCRTIWQKSTSVSLVILAVSSTPV